MISVTTDARLGRTAERTPAGMVDIVSTAWTDPSVSVKSDSEEKGIDISFTFHYTLLSFTLLDYFPTSQPVVLCQSLRIKLPLFVSVSD